MSCASLKYKDDYLIINNFYYHGNDEYYNTTFDVEVSSGKFKGVAPCEYNFPDFCRFVAELAEMYNFKRQVVVFKDICYGSEIEFKSDNIGHIEVSGEIFGTSMEHILKFSFVADQFVLNQFINELNKLI